MISQYNIGLGITKVSKQEIREKNLHSNNYTRCIAHSREEVVVLRWSEVRDGEAATLTPYSLGTIDR